MCDLTSNFKQSVPSNKFITKCLIHIQAKSDGGLNSVLTKTPGNLLELLNSN